MVLCVGLVALVMTYGRQFYRISDSRLASRSCQRLCRSSNRGIKRFELDCCSRPEFGVAGRDSAGINSDYY